LPTWRRAILPRPLLITGASGTLGRAFARLCDQRGLRYRLLTRQQMDIADQAAVSRTVEELNPWAVVNAAGYVRVDEAERESARCLRENTDGPSILAAACAQRNVQLLTFSSDLVFDGRRRQPYLEGDTVGPLGVYGHSKAKAERRVLELLPTALVVRTSAFFGAWDHHNFVAVVLKSLRAGLRFIAAEDVMVSPTYVPDLVHACLDLIIDRESGVWHLANCGAITWADLARRAADFAHGHANNIEGRPLATLGWPAPRPAYSVLSSERGSLLPSLDDALSRHFGDPHLQTLICS
jgi:dTDP-4-dehydrorhamnose reductase